MAEENVKITIEFDVKDKTGDGDKDKDTVEIKKTIRQRDVNEEVDRFSAGNVGEIQKFSSTQFGNIKQFATNPVLFVFRSFSKLLKGPAAVAFFIALAAAVVSFVLDFLFAPGRPLDPRFKKEVDKLIQNFSEVKARSELRQGFRTLIVSTIPGLRGLGIRGQISGNLYRNPSYMAGDFLDIRLTVEPNRRTMDNRLERRANKATRF